MDIQLKDLSVGDLFEGHSVISNIYDEETGEYVITLDGSLNSINDGAFASDEQMKKFVVPETVYDIDVNAFKKCKKLECLDVTKVSDETASNIPFEDLPDCSAIANANIDTDRYIGEISALYRMGSAYLDSANNYSDEGSSDTMIFVEKAGNTGNLVLNRPDIPEKKSTVGYDSSVYGYYDEYGYPNNYYATRQLDTLGYVWSTNFSNGFPLCSTTMHPYIKSHFGFNFPVDQYHSMYTTGQTHLVEGKYASKVIHVPYTGGTGTIDIMKYLQLYAYTQENGANASIGDYDIKYYFASDDMLVRSTSDNHLGTAYGIAADEELLPTSFGAVDVSVTKGSSYSVARYMVRNDKFIDASISQDYGYVKINYNASVNDSSDYRIECLRLADTYHGKVARLIFIQDYKAKRIYYGENGIGSLCKGFNYDNLSFKTTMSARKYPLYDVSVNMLPAATDFDIELNTEEQTIDDEMVEIRHYIYDYYVDYYVAIPADIAGQYKIDITYNSTDESRYYYRDSSSYVDYLNDKYLQHKYRFHNIFNKKVYTKDGNMIVLLNEDEEEQPLVFASKIQLRRL